MKSKSANILRKLQSFESPNITYIDPDGTWPIVWERAKGVYVWDAGGRKYLDLTAGFGVAAAGHANRQVVETGQRQMAKLLHAMGDVHPHGLKAELAEQLSALTFERWRSVPAKTIFCNSGFEAVEAALKTALLATGKAGVIAFQGAYHGTGYGSLSATSREFFRLPFQSQLKEFGIFVPFPSRRDELAQAEKQIRQLIARHPVGAILIEPVQGRGGIRIPPSEFLPLLRRLSRQAKALLVVDEIYTGMGRTGKWFACEHTGTVPDLICLGKALTGGFPLSACVGRADLMDAAWPKSTGEAIHTSTFLGHPVGCAMALAQIRQIQKGRLVERSAQLGKRLLQALGDLAETMRSNRSIVIDGRGLGLMVGLEILETNHKPGTTLVLQTIKAMLQRGYILLPEGDASQVISFTPPLTISKDQLSQTVAELSRVLHELAE